MAQPTNETKAGAGILPDTELNPLVNPLLAAHMGRWAEVYFTSPPEKRAQAVSDLVRELSNDSSSPASLPAPPTISREPLWPKVEDEAAEVPAGFGAAFGLSANPADTRTPHRKDSAACVAHL